MDTRFPRFGVLIGGYKVKSVSTNQNRVSPKHRGAIFRGLELAIVRQ